jgi:hypothetical protein
MSRFVRGSGLIEAHQDVAGLDPVALVDSQLTDDATDGVLDLFDIALHHELP